MMFGIAGHLVIGLLLLAFSLVLLWVFGRLSSGDTISTVAAMVLWWLTLILVLISLVVVVWGIWYTIYPRTEKRGSGLFGETQKTPPQIVQTGPKYPTVPSNPVFANDA